MISLIQSRKTLRRRATFCKRRTNKLNLSSICYSKLFIYIYIDSKTLRRTPLYIWKKSTTEHPREEEKRGMASQRRTVSKYLQNNPVCETKPYYGLFVRRFENVLRRRTASHQWQQPGRDKQGAMT